MLNLEGLSPNSTNVFPLELINPAELIFPFIVTKTALVVIKFAAVSNAAPSVIQAAHWVSTCAGGDGAVRECCEFILESRA